MEFLDYVANFFHYSLSFIVILSIVVFVHEWGHFIIARMCGVKVEEFSIGFGKELYGWDDSKGTRWKVCLLPLGGFVKMFGDADGASTADEEKLNNMSEKDKKISFHFKPLWQKAAVVFAGPAINFILAFVIYFMIFAFNGKVESELSTKIGQVLEGGVAQEMGIEEGDYIISIGGEKVDYYSQVHEKIMLAPSVETELTFTKGKDGEKITKYFVPQRNLVKDKDGKVLEARIGVGPSNEYAIDTTITELSFAEAAVESAHKVYDSSVKMLIGVGQLITGERSVKDMGGPVKIAEYSGMFTEGISAGANCYFNRTFYLEKALAVEDKDCGKLMTSGIITALSFMAMISTMLGLVNLFPIPMLDGGHLAFYTIEAIIRKPMAEKYQEFAFRVGFVFLVGLMLYVTYNDIVSFVERYVLS